MNLQAAKNLVKAKFPFIDPQKISQSYVVANTDLASTNNVKFGLQKNALGRAPYGCENLISNNDLFVMTHMKLSIYKTASDTPSEAQRGAALRYNYVNKNTGLFDGSNDANLQALYQSKFSLTMDQVTYLVGIHTSNFERVPTSQQGTTSAAYVDQASADQEFTIGRDGKPNSLYGFYQTDMFVLNGQSSINPLITLPATYDFDESSETNTAVLELKGFNIVNGAIDYADELAAYLKQNY